MKTLQIRCHVCAASCDLWNQSRPRAISKEALAESLALLASVPSAGYTKSALLLTDGRRPAGSAISDYGLGWPEYGSVEVSVVAVGPSELIDWDHLSWSRPV